MEEPILNAHNKEEYPPMHTAEHILNGTMVKMFGCPRSRNAHIERKKSKCDYILPCCPTDEPVAGQMESTVNLNQRRSGIAWRIYWVFRRYLSTRWFGWPILLRN